MRKRGISAVVSAVLIAGITIAECFCSSVPTHAKEDNNDLQSTYASTGSTSLSTDKKKEVETEQNNDSNDDTTGLDKTSLDNSSNFQKENNQISPKAGATPPTPKEPVEDTEVEPLPVPVEKEVEKPVEEKWEEEVFPVKELQKHKATFRILKNSNGEIDESTAYSTGNEYITEIKIDDAVIDGTDNLFTSTVSDGGNNDNIEDVTLQNRVSDSLICYPTADDIKSKCTSFDPAKQYIAWYYINADYYDDIYVDGVIRERSVPVVTEPSKTVELDPDFIPDVTIKIETTCDMSEFVYDGEEHYFGGFSITVSDNNPIVNSVTTFFDALGNFVSQKVNAGQNGSGTYFEHNNIRYWVNIDAAYVVAKQITSYEIPFIFNNKEIAPEDIVVKVVDDAGNVISSIPTTHIEKKQPTRNQFKVTSRKITIEAGTTVQNYSGQTITNKNVEITSGSLLKGHSLVDVVINGSQSGIGSSVNEITSYRIVDEYGNDVTKYYNVECVNGRLVLVDGHNSKKSGNSGDDNAPVTTGIKEKALPKKAVIIGGKAMEKTSSENNKILGVSRIARMSKTFDESNINLRLLIILLATGTAIYLSQIKVKE